MDVRLVLHMSRISIRKTMMRILAELEHDSESTRYIDSINTYEPFITEFLIYNILKTNVIFRWPSWLCYIDTII